MHATCPFLVHFNFKKKGRKRTFDCLYGHFDEPGHVGNGQVGKLNNAESALCNFATNVHGRDWNGALVRPTEVYLSNPVSEMGPTFRNADTI